MKLIDWKLLSNEWIPLTFRFFDDFGLDFRKNDDELMMLQNDLLTNIQ